MLLQAIFPLWFCLLWRIVWSTIIGKTDVRLDLLDIVNKITPVIKIVLIYKNFYCLDLQSISKKFLQSFNVKMN